MLTDYEKSNNEKKNEGASLVEYVLLVSLIAAVCIVAIRVLGTSTSQFFSNFVNQWING